MLPTRLSLLISFVVTPAVLLLGLLRLRSLRGRLGPHTTVRFASLNPPPDPGPLRWWWGLMLATLVPLAASALLLHLRWSTIPARFPTHWGLAGQPNGWANRTPAGVFGLLLTAALIVLALGALGELIARSSPGHADRPQMIRTTRSVLLGSAWLLTLLFSATSLLPLAPDPTNLAPLVVLAGSLLSLALVSFALVRFLRIGPALQAGRHSTEPRFWRLGLFYCNPADTALLVPKRFGFGYTVNLGQPLAWLALAAILVLPWLIPLLLHLSRPH